MRTDDLIATLSGELEPVKTGTVTRTLLGAIALGLAGSVLVMLLTLGLRHDLGAALSSFGLWLKLAYTFAIAAFGFWLVERAGRPGAPFMAWPAPVGAAGAGDRPRGGGAASGARRRHARSGHGPVRPRLSLPGGDGVAAHADRQLLGARRLAPTRLTLAGALAGLFAGARAPSSMPSIVRRGRALCRPLVQPGHPAHRRYRRPVGPPPAALVKHCSRLSGVTFALRIWRRGICANSFFAAALIALAHPASADPLMDGGSAYEHGDYPRALAAWQPLAAQGNAEAQNNLGSALSRRQRRAAEHCPRRCATFSFPPRPVRRWARTISAAFTATATGVPRDFGKAARWFAASASSGQFRRHVQSGPDV